ncbi:MAG: hypothetical protein HGB37_00645 [Candidatus Moranbacteria bacterium]|nr:hypothetical protein [Candidatus Moranbacteria bacterium]
MKELIGRKIDEIRGEPEHVRVRYVWGSVLIVMVLLFSFWIMTLRSGLRAMAPADTKAIQQSIPSSIREIENQGQSITQMIESTTLTDEGVPGSAQDSAR